MTEALAGRITLEEAVRYISFQPAKLFDLFPRKGVIRSGSDADILIYDPRVSGTIDSTKWFSKARAVERLYHGRPVQGSVHTTIVNGNIAFQNGKILGSPGDGRFVRP